MDVKNMWSFKRIVDVMDHVSKFTVVQEATKSDRKAKVLLHW